MSFYTNVYNTGSKMLVREMRDGVESREKMAFEPSLFIPCKKPSMDSGWKSISGDPLTLRKFTNSYAANKYARDHVDMFPVYGTVKPEIQFVSSQYPKDIDYNLDEIRIFCIDIEVYAKNGFPKPELAKEIINAITVYDSYVKKYLMWGLEKPGDSYTPKADSVYQGFSNELKSSVKPTPTNFPRGVSSRSVPLKGCMAPRLNLIAS